MSSFSIAEDLLLSNLTQMTYAGILMVVVNRCKKKKQKRQKASCVYSVVEKKGEFLASLSYEIVY